MSKDTQVDQLIINTLTKEQYNQITPAQNQLYFITNDSGSVIQGNGFNLFDIVMKDHILDFEESEGFGSLGTYVYKDAVAGSRYGYPDFYAKCLEEYQDVNNTTETISNVTIIINANGHKFYDIADKATIDTIYNSTGEAWFYGIDTTNERIFLPRDNEVMHGKLIESYIEGTNWYRIYSDGWCEQGGVSYGSDDYTFVFLKPYVNTNYSVMLTNGSDGTWSYNITTSVISRSTNSVTVKMTDYSTANSPGFWQTKGYINSNYESYKKPYIVVGNTAQVKVITDITDITTSTNDTLPLFTGMYFDYNPNNVGWLLGGEQANSGSIYTTAYNELVNELTLPKYNLKVIEEEDMVSGTDYSEYWIVNQTQQYFICPTKLSYDALSGSEIPVYGNGMTVGVTDGTTNAGLLSPTGNYAGYIVDNDASYGTPVGTTWTSGTPTTGYTVGITSDPTKSGIVTDLNSAKSATAKLYFKVANAVENLELLDAGEVMEALSGKVNISDLSKCHVVVETYVNGTSWYRVYDDGWCEQGGYKGSGQANSTVTFLKPFKDTNYSAFICPSQTGDITYKISTGTRTTTTCRFIVEGYSTSYNWQACGYIS